MKSSCLNIHWFWKLKTSKQQFALTWPHEYCSLKNRQYDRISLSSAVLSEENTSNFKIKWIFSTNSIKYWKAAIFHTALPISGLLAQNFKLNPVKLLTTSFKILKYRWIEEWVKWQTQGSKQSIPEYGIFYRQIDTVSSICQMAWEKKTTHNQTPYKHFVWINLNVSTM